MACHATKRRCATATSTDSTQNTEKLLQKLAQAIQEEPNVAKQLANKLKPNVKNEIQRAWSAFDATDNGTVSRTPQPWQLRRLAILAALPMLGFGFMDNFVMILAGDFIDATFAFKLGLSTMCAAGVGNVLSDMLGVITAGPIESTLRNLDIQGPNLSPRQMKMTSVLSAKYLGSAVGVGIGCIVGMCPLLWPESIRLWSARRDLEAERTQKRAMTEYDSEATRIIKRALTEVTK